MEIERHPSPWPCVAMLVGLLLFCLTVPGYWQRNAGQEDSRGHSDSKTNGDARSRDMFFGGAKQQIPGLNEPNCDPLNLWTPTIEELIARRMAAIETVIAEAPQWQTPWPVLVPPSTGANAVSDSGTRSFSLIEPDPIVIVTVHQIGRVMGQYSVADAVSQLLSKAARSYAAWMDGDEVRGLVARRSTLRLTGPNDRLAMASPWTSGTHSHRSVAGCWCVPEVLFQQLEGLASEPETAEWATRVLAQLHDLTERDEFKGDDVRAVLADLSESTLDAVQLADVTANDRLRVELLRAHWALARRLDCWSVMYEMHLASRVHGRLAMRGSLSQVFDNAPGAPQGDSNAENVVTITNQIEEYERTRDPQLGRQIAKEQQTLTASVHTMDRSLAEAMEQHYRNANIRVAITAQMLNRVLGDKQSDVQPIRERIAGTAVRGQSNIETDSRVLLNPTDGQWQIEINTDGVVDSRTVASGGPAQLRSRGNTDFSARKSIVVNPAGVLMQPALVDATSQSRLVSVTTDYDWVPLFGTYVRDRARAEYAAKRRWAESQAESRIESQAGETIDQKTQEAVNQIQRQVWQRFTREFDKAGVKITPIAMTTTNERVVARLRVASDNQPGSHTPRPRALSDSLASLQVHETALTNAAVSLELDGRSYSAPELQDLLRENFAKVATADPAVAQKDAVFHFAANDAVQFRIEKGRVEIIVTMAGIEMEGDATRDLVVHAFYVPVVNGLDAELVRDGALGIEGRLSSADRARLHNVFKEVFSPDRRLPIVRLGDPTDRRFEGLMITQMVLEDGWMGLAIGPTTDERVAERSRSLRH